MKYTDEERETLKLCVNVESKQFYIILHKQLKLFSTGTKNQKWSDGNAIVFSSLNWKWSDGNAIVYSLLN